MVKVKYRSDYYNKELVPGEIFYTIPSCAFLEIIPDEDDVISKILVDGKTRKKNDLIVDCDSSVEVVILANGEKYTYTVETIVSRLKDEYAKAYEQFLFDYENTDFDEIESIQLGAFKLYAVDQSTDVKDCTEILKHIENAYPKFKTICDNPKSHLKAVNEVRPIETVKRVGHESIPYLASHSEDWLARTASGLKPARLYSRVEDDEYQIYENRVVKTLIDRIILFLQRREKELEKQLNQLNEIMNSGVHTDSFGYDMQFAIAVNELVSQDEEGFDKRSEAMDLADKLLRKAKILLKKYRSLKQTRLYRYLVRSKAVTNPLNETNILLMDKNYSVVYSLWKIIQKELAVRKLEEEIVVAPEDIDQGVIDFCKAICGYTAYNMKFELQENGKYCRKGDNLELLIEDMDGYIKVHIGDIRRHELQIQQDMVPINSGEVFETFSYDGSTLSWENSLNPDDIDAFCSLHKKTRGKGLSDKQGRLQNEEKRKYTELKQILYAKENEYPPALKHDFVILAPGIALEKDNCDKFHSFMLDRAEELLESTEADKVIVIVPRCDEGEQKITSYARYEGEKVLFLPITLFDINSYRRMQNVLVRYFASMGNDTCPMCGGVLKVVGDHRACKSCGDEKTPLIFKRTICPEADCKHQYMYMEYDVKLEVLEKMETVDDGNFYHRDSLFQYKDIVPMVVRDKKLRTICPKCRR